MKSDGSPCIKQSISHLLASKVDEDEALIADFDVVDDEEETRAKINSAEIRLLTSQKKPLESNSHLLNNAQFRETYLRQ